MFSTVQQGKFKAGLEAYFQHLDELLGCIPLVLQILYDCSNLLNFYIKHNFLKKMSQTIFATCTLTLIETSLKNK